MPIYVYHCADCQHEMEVLQPVSAPKPRACSSCGSLHLEKTFGAFGIRYNSSGFYSTDYKSKTAPSAPEVS